MKGDDVEAARAIDSTAPEAEPASLGPLSNGRAMPDGPSAGKPRAPVGVPKVVRRNRPAIGQVEMLADDWLVEMAKWIRKLTRAKSLSKLAVKIGVELALSVERTKSSPDAGFAIRSHGWLMQQFGGSRSNVQEAIGQLHRLGFIKVQSSKREGVANRYQLWFPPVSFWTEDDDAPPF